MIDCEEGDLWDTRRICWAEGGDYILLRFGSRIRFKMLLKA